MQFLNVFSHCLALELKKFVTMNNVLNEANTLFSSLNIYSKILIPLNVFSILIYPWIKRGFPVVSF